MDGQSLGLGSRPTPRSYRLAGWAVKYEIPLFFLLTFVFSWTIYLIIHQIKISNQTVLSRWLLVAAFGPSFMAVVLSGIGDPERVKSTTIRPILVFVLMAIVAAGVEFWDHQWWGHTIPPSLMVVDTVLVLLVAFVVSGALSSRRGVRDLLLGLFRWRIGAGWYLVAFGLWPVLVLVANGLGKVLNAGVPASPNYPATIPLVPLVFESFLWYLLFGGPLNEEAGWRAFALVKLQRRSSPLLASMIIGVFWGLWHVPLHLMGMYPFGPQGAAIRIFDIPTAILFTWLFNRSDQSLLTVLILHAVRNTTSLFLPRNYITSSLLLLLLAVILVFTDKMWRSPSKAENEA